MLASELNEKGCFRLRTSSFALHWDANMVCIEHPGTLERIDVNLKLNKPSMLFGCSQTRVMFLFSQQYRYLPRMMSFWAKTGLLSMLPS